MINAMMTTQNREAAPVTAHVPDKSSLSEHPASTTANTHYSTLRECLFGTRTTTQKDDDATDLVDALAPVHSKSWESVEKSTGHLIDLKELRKLVSASGILEDDDTGRSYRGVAWRVLLGYLPVEVSKWEDVLQQNRSNYMTLAAQLFVDIHDVQETSYELRANQRKNSSLNRRSSRNFRGYSTKKPLPESVKTYWKSKHMDLHVLERLTKDLNALRMPDDNTNNADDDTTDMVDFCENALLLDEIRKDVVRTHPDSAFFLEPYGSVGRRRYAALERILLLWSKHNSAGVKYVQGMNEIVGILYHVLATDQNDEWNVWAEADCYYLFHSLMAELSDVFVAGLDDHDTGIQGRIHAMAGLLARHDPEVREHLDELGIDVSFYAIRWWTTLLSREFLIPDTIRLWDSMFASTHKDNFLRYVCVTMVMGIREDLLTSDFSACLKLLHSYPSSNMDDLLESSRALWIYESQVGVACQRGGLNIHQALTTIQSPRSLIMAFGFPNGTPPVSRSEQIERAKSNVESSVRNALGRARGLYKSWYSKEYSTGSSDSATDQALALGRAKEEHSQADDDIYMSAILKTTSK